MCHNNMLVYHNSVVVVFFTNLQQPDGNVHILQLYFTLK